MNNQPKYRLGEEVNVDFTGKIVSVSYNYLGTLKYKVTSENGNEAYIEEQSINPLPIPPEPPKPEQIITCKVCSTAFKQREFDSHLFENGELKKDHTPPSDYKHNGYLDKCYFCDGKLRTIGRGDEGWETFCVDCGFLWDED